MVSSYFYCRIWSEGLLYDAEHDLVAIAVFIIVDTYYSDVSIVLYRFSEDNFYAVYGERVVHIDGSRIRVYAKIEYVIVRRICVHNTFRMQTWIYV